MSHALHPTAVCLLLATLSACQGGPAAVPPAAPASAAPKTSAAAPTSAAAAPASAPGSAAVSPAALAELLPPYLKIQEALAADSLAGVAEAAAQLGQALKSAGQPALASATEPLAGTDIKAVRTAFKAVSNPIADWALADEAARKEYAVVHCPMAPGSWVQRHRAVRNPYYGKDMLECGDLKN